MALESWKYAKELVGVRWSIEEFIQKLDSIPEGREDILVAFILIYLGAFRRQEFCQLRIVDKNNIVHIRRAFGWRDLYFECVDKEKDLWAMMLNIRILKQDRHKAGHLKWYKKRTVPIPIFEKDRYDKPLTDYIINYLERIGWFDKEQGFFDYGDKLINASETPFSTLHFSTLEEYANKWLNANLHYLRHLKFGHAVFYDKCSPQILQILGGWISGELPLKYSKATSQDVIKALWRLE